MDFIRKPFSSEALKIRIRNLIDLISLQRDLHCEVAKKTAELESLSLHVVHTLAKTIDAKDAYTNGHSERVAAYSREIARRYGYDEDRQEEIYIMGLLHDVGKIGVPDSIINKQGKLTDEEYATIKTHPSVGAEILTTVSEMPKLVTGARWHHERYDGRGYPDGLKGEEIPEEARIIAVADAYDAMTSHRSYRDIIPQDHVKSEIEKGMNTQFDEKFARIMLEMIAEDTEYRMHE
ncbi:MAG: HD-GYP domain-containing protein [Lachnospiraceae bacterium]|nr:HD-GYP domain-containing protein [Lachnospiraceae bacterium]